MLDDEAAAVEVMLAKLLPLRNLSWAEVDRARAVLLCRDLRCRHARRLQGAPP
jgi:hypothetical protein